MRVPGIAARTVTTPITTPDILPTLLALSGVTIPQSVEGEDLSPLLRSGRDADRAALYMCVSPFARNVPPGKLAEYRAIRTSRYTYVRGLQGPWMLFDDQKDVHQTNNLIGKAELATMARELDDQLQAELKRIADDFRPGKTYLAEWGYEIGSHGSVPYAATLTKVQTPRRHVMKPTTATPTSGAEKSSP
jgi:arylsulfatase A-like enzyme